MTGVQTCALPIYITLLPTWVPRDQNKVADGLTHLEDPCDWTLNADVFQRIVAQWDLPTIDRFASHPNHLLDRFNSILRCPGSVGINALAQRDWSEHFNWCFPPFNLIPSVISIIRQFSAASILVLSGQLALGGLYCLKDNTSFLLYTVVACYHA